MLEKWSWYTFFLIAGGFCEKEQISQLLLPAVPGDVDVEPVVCLLVLAVGSGGLGVLKLFGLVSGRLYGYPVAVL